VARGEIELLGAPSLDWLGVPLKRGEATFGVLAVQSYSERVRFTEGDRDILTFVAQHVSSALERKRAGEALRESEIRFRTLAETAPCAIFIYQGSEIRYVNAVAAETSGYAAEELLRMSFWDLVHPDFHELLRERGFARQRGDAVPLRSEFKILTKSQDERSTSPPGSSSSRERRPSSAPPSTSPSGGGPTSRSRPWPTTIPSPACRTACSSRTASPWPWPRPIA